jgi:kynurenine formamidase
MTVRQIDLGQSAVLHCRDLATLDRAAYTNVFGMMLQSVGPMRHAANVPFHDSQARGKAILIRTDWDEVRSEPGPYLHEELIFRLIRARVRVVGLDFGGADYSGLTAAGVPVVEYLANFKSLPKWGFHLTVEAQQTAGDVWPARAFAQVTEAEGA